MKKIISKSLFAAVFVIGIGSFTTTTVQAQMDKSLSCWDKTGSKVNLENFDDLDFNVFTDQKWDQVSNSHGKDIIVHWPDGRTTKGIDAHIQ